MNTSSFKETQRFRQIWVWLLIIGMIAVFGWAFIQQIGFGEPWGTKPAPDTVLILLSLVPVGMLILFLITRLKTEIDESGIYYQFLPFHFTRHRIEWETIHKASVRKYRPIYEYGGWGVRFSFGRGKAYNVSGDYGLQIEFKNGKQLLIGTQRPEEIEQLLQRLADKKVVDHSR
jgi:uncharacterized membrane protein YobD (UPF0266 family)